MSGREKETPRDLQTDHRAVAETSGDDSTSTPKWATPRTMTELVAAAEQRGAEWLKREVWWRGAHYVLLVLGSVLAAIAAAVAVAQVWNGTLAGVLALTASALTAAAAVLRPAVMAVGCGAKAAEYLEVARDARRADEEPGPADAKRAAYYELLAATTRSGPLLSRRFRQSPSEADSLGALPGKPRHGSSRINKQRFRPSGIVSSC